MIARCTDQPMSSPSPCLPTRISKDLTGCIPRHRRLACVSEAFCSAIPQDQKRYRRPARFQSRRPLFTSYCKQRYFAKSTLAWRSVALGPPKRHAKPTPKPNPSRQRVADHSFLLHADSSVPNPKFSMIFSCSHPEALPEYSNLFARINRK